MPAPVPVLEALPEVAEATLGGGCVLLGRVTYPVVMGGGVRLFAESGEPTVLRLVDARAFDRAWSR